MLTALHIIRYRGLPELKINGLKWVNLVVGKNNTGKTALLEAVELLLARYTPKAWLRSPLRRGEVLPLVRGDFDQAVEIRHLFFGHRIEAGSEFAIRGRATRRAGLPEESEIRVRIVSGKEETQTLQDAPMPARDWFSRLTLQICRTQVSPDESAPISAEGWTWAPRYGNPTCRLDQDGIMPLVFVPTDSLNGDDLVQLWDSINFEQGSDIIRDALRGVFPDVDRLGPLASAKDGRSAKAFSVLLRNEKTVSPLGTLGDGVRRLLGVLLATVQAQNGFVFIDEIDGGLHHSLMRDMWRMIFQTAVKLNVQVFATTHSSDCWRSLGYLCASEPEIAKQVSVHRLEHGLEHTIRYTPEELATAAEQDIDIR